MDDKNIGNPKPLRSTSNKMRDLIDTYVKHQEPREIHIKDGESEKAKAKTEEHLPPMPDEADLTEKENDENEKIIIELNDKLTEVSKERDEIREQMLRTVAEFENFRKRAIKDKQDFVEYANEKLLFKMLDLLDDIGNAIDSGKDNQDYQALYKGIEMIGQKAMKLFEETGVKIMDNPIGKPFNVDLQDAIMHIPSELPEDYVVHEVQAGYFYNGKVLRHAKVITSNGIAEVRTETVEE